MQDFPANSNRAKATDAPREKIEPVTTGEAVQRKRGLGRKFKGAFFSGDPRDAFGYMIEEVIVPSARDLFHDAVSSWFEQTIYGRDNRPRPGRSTGPLTNTGLGRVDYSGISRQPQARPQGGRTISREARARHDFGDIHIQSLTEANEVIDRMYDLLSRDGMVSVADLYELTGIRSAHTDVKWGWTNLRGARALPDRRRGTYVLDLPTPQPLG